MNEERDGRESDGGAPPQPAAPLGGNLPFLVELWRADLAAVERVMARAAVMSVARALFDAVCREHPGRRITLRRGGDILLSQGGSSAPGSSR